MSGTDSTPGDGITSDLPMAVAQILGPDGTVAGTGFLVAEGVVVTCAHVVEAAGGGPGSEVRLSFPYVAGADHVVGAIPAGLWRPAEREDVAYLRLNDPPAGVGPCRWAPLKAAEAIRRAPSDSPRRPLGKDTSVSARSATCCPPWQAEARTSS